MGVYVDDLQLWAGVRRHDAPWSHLFADTDEELHAFAARLGITPEWFDRGKHPWLNHYDVTAEWRQQAIRLGATAVTIREAKQILRVRAAEAKATRTDGQEVQRKRHSWDKQDKHHKTCRDCGIEVLARPHPYERRWYQEYTTADGRCFVADRVPPCEPAAQPRPVPESERVRHASELDHAAGRAWQQGDLQRAARLIADARALDPARSQLWDQREATLAASAPRSVHRGKPAPTGLPRSCSTAHPHQDAYLAARRSMETGDTGRCHDGHPVSDLAEDISARLIAAGYTASSPELTRIRDWNHHAFERAGSGPPDPAAEAETP